MDGNMAKQDNPQVFLSEIQEIEQEMQTNYFQQGMGKVGANTKEVWRFAISGSSDTRNLLKLAKATINKAQWHITINMNQFDEINYYFAGWLSGADPEVLQLTDVGNAINNSMSLLKLEKSRSKRMNRAATIHHVSGSKQSDTLQQSLGKQRWHPQSI
jgi:hypothetical protein